MNKENLVKLLIQNEFEKLFSQLNTDVSPKQKKEWKRSIINLESRYQKIKTDNQKGIIDHSKYYLELNRIRDSLNSVIENIEIEEKSNFKKKQKSSLLKKNSTQFNFRIVWILFGIGIFLFGVFPTKTITIDNLKIHCKDQWININLNKPWSQGNLKLDNIWVKNASVSEDDSMKFQRFFEADGDITLEGFFFPENQLLKIGTELNGISVTLKANKFHGSLIAYPESKLTFLSPSDNPITESIESIDTVQGERTRYEFITMEDKPEALIRLVFSNPQNQFDEEMNISRISFFTSDGGTPKSLIDSGELQLDGIAKNKFANLSSSDYIKFHSRKSLPLKISQSNDILIFKNIMKSDVEFFNKKSEPVQSLRFKVWMEQNPNLSLISIIVWIVILILSIFKTKKK